METNNNHKIRINKSIPGISQRTMEKIYTEWQESGYAPTKISPDIEKQDEELLIQQMKDCISKKSGEFSNKSRVVHLGLIYLNCSAEGKAKFLKILAKNFDVDTDLLNQKIKNLKLSQTEDDKIQSELELMKALIPPRLKLLRQFITLPNGFIFLKDMRRDLLPLSKSIPRLKKLDNDIKNMLKSFFDINLLDLTQITWNSPAALLEKLIEYEAVHEIGSWKNLKHRLHADHRIFAFMHNKMPNEPLVFVEVALVNGISGNIQELLNENTPSLNPQKADTAIFYSISSTQKGLAGINFGNFLIKRVVKEITKELPNIQHFSTLSPIPKFKQWIESLEPDDRRFITEKELKQLKRFSRTKYPIKILLKILDTNWQDDPKKVEALKAPLMRLCAHYLIHEKRDAKAVDPVANFHLRNGAKIFKLNWMADTSEKGMRQSFGIMVNYYYKLNKIIVNHEGYLSESKIYASKIVRDWLKKS
ncbi:malonyl-CoA decarboxylase [Bacteroidota bacterium]